MLIKELKDNYPLVYETALKNSIDKNENEGLGSAFIWKNTNEGEDFWLCITDSKFDKAKKLCPHLFKDKTTSKYKVGDKVKSIKGGWQYTEGGLENDSALSYRRSDYNLIEGKITKIIYSNKHKIWFYKIGGYGNMFTENAIELLSDDKEDNNKKYSNGKPLIEFIKGEWYTNPEHSKVPKYCRIKSIKICKESGTEYYYNRFVFDAIADENWNITEGLNITQANNSFDEKMVRVDKPELKSNISDRDKLLEEARLKYPIGTKYKCPDEPLFSNEIVQYTPRFLNDYKDYIEGSCGYLYYEGKWAEIITEPEVKEYKGKVVHVDTQEKWDFVTRELNYKWFSNKTWNDYKTNSCINLESKSYLEIGLYKNNNYQILSFNEYLSLNLLNYEWEEFIQSKDNSEFKWEELQNKPVDYSNFFEKGKWYYVRTKYEWIIQFKEIKNNSISRFICINLETKRVTTDNSQLCNLDRIKFAREAESHEYEKYLKVENKNNSLEDVDYNSSVSRKDVGLHNLKYINYDNPSFKWSITDETPFNGKTLCNTEKTDKFMEPIQVKPYKKNNKIKLIFNN